ncbi:MAG: phosphonate transport system substrate-binding protein [Desulfonauticus sp.]|nr:phosphonate transport system substrate-binding protein [Desulfonauticus sp.]
MKKALFVLFSLFFLLVSNLSFAKDERQEWPKKIVFAVIPVASSREMTESFRPLIDFLANELGIDVDFKVADDYSAVITGMMFKKVDVAYFGPKSYCEAAKRANAEAIAVELNKDTGVAGYYGLIITKKGSGLKSIEDLKGHSWAFTDPQSTSGTLVPSVFFARIGIDPNKYFSRVLYSGSHEASILAVKNGKVDAASTNDLDFARGLGKHWSESDFNIIWKSKMIPGSPIAVRKDLPSSLKMALKGAFISFKDKKGLNKLKIKGYGPADDSLYNSVRELIEFKEKLKRK